MLTENDIYILINLVKSAEYIAKVTQADNELRDTLLKLIEKLDNLDPVDEETK